MRKAATRKYSFTGFLIGINLGIAVGAAFGNLAIGIPSGLLLGWALSRLFVSKTKRPR